MEEKKYDDLGNEIFDETEEQAAEAEGATTDLDWKAAAQKLKAAKAKYAEDYTIDTYYIKIDINALRDRYNNKERTPELYADIMAVEV